MRKIATALTALALMAGGIATATPVYAKPVTLEIVGENFHKSAIKYIKAKYGTNKDFTITLMPEPSNPYDSKAVLVLVDGKASAYVAKGPNKAVFGPATVAVKIGKPLRGKAELRCYSGNCGIFGWVDIP